MTRLEKKCFVAASGTHALLFLILLVGPAFFVARDRVEPAHIITLVAGPVVDAPSSGGSTTAPPPPAAQQNPQPPAPRPHSEPPKADPKPPEPVKHEPKPDKSFEPPTKPKIHQTELDPSELKPVHKTSSVTKKNTPTKNTDDTRAQDLANQRRIAAINSINSAARSLDGKFGKAVAIDAGPIGDGGPAMTNYRDIVASKYTIAWQPPATLDDDTATVTVTVIIARSGKVVDSRIKRPSGNSVMDKSIETLLENVTFIEPFPRESDDAQRTFTIKFNLQAKRGLG